MFLSIGVMILRQHHQRDTFLLAAFSVFVVTGDDMDWVRSRLLPRVGSASVYPVGDGRQANRDIL